MSLLFRTSEPEKRECGKDSRAGEVRTDTEQQS